MISLLSKIFIPNRNDFKDATVRRAYGMLCGVCGIILNLFLFAVKFLAGTLTGSIAITADAFNNLADAGSSIITLFGFRLAGQKPDPEHPFGHGRMEYISGLFVSIAILIMGYELAKTSIDKILHPQLIQGSTLSIVILIVAVLVKLYIMLYNFSIGKKINSVAMRATAKDSLSDTLSTLVVLASTLIGTYAELAIDGWCGILVSVFIFISGVTALKETIGPLLGQPPEPEFIEEIVSIVNSHPEVLGIHDLIVHNYGPGRQMISLHAEVSADSDLSLIHDTIDNIERELIEKTGAHAVIHMDPIVTNDEKLNELKGIIRDYAKSLSDTLSIHDFRMVDGPTHTNIIFDVLVPFRFSMTDEELRHSFAEYVHGLDERYFAVIEIDKDYNNMA